jgi:hypothetical protein
MATDARDQDRPAQIGARTMTLEERIRADVEFPIRKHDLNSRYDQTVGDMANEQINGWTNVELLERISTAIEEMQEAQNDGK